MKLKTVKISNVLSFKHYEDISQCPELRFDANGCSDFHILIGPNGSGKSNFLEILNQIFKNILFKRCQFNKTVFLNRKSDISFERNKKNILQALEQNVANLNKNWGHVDNPQKILLSLSLNDNDYKNIDFVVDNAKKIDEYLTTYSGIGINFANLIGGVDVGSFKGSIRQQSIDITFSRNTEGEKFTVVIEAPNNEKNFIKQYLEYFEFLQSVIEINNIEKSTESLEPLKDTFTLISCYRNYNAVQPSYSANNQDENSVLTDLRNKHYQDNTLESKNEEPIVFGLVKHRLSYEGFRLFDAGNKTKEEIVSELHISDLYKSINKLLEEFLDITLSIEIQSSHNWTFVFHVKKKDKIINFQNLSAGQKGIIHLIFSLYGYDIENGLFVIDEPELHLHPQLQKKYIAIVQQESKGRDIQFIVSTHSPVFVSEKTINNIQRFHFDEEENTSQIVHPEITEDDKFLIKVLNYTNASKIFFVDRAILVEGESDEYFFNFYINYLKDKQEETSKKIDDFEIYNIGGKGGHFKWREFLKKWGLEVYFIADWDNVKGISLVDQDWKDKINQNREGATKKSYPEIINLLKTEDAQKYNDLLSKIESKRTDGVFILKEGELEDYLNISKDLSETIRFCNEFDESKLQHNDDLKEIIECIFS